MIELILEQESKECENPKNENSGSKIDIKRVFLSDMMLLLNHNHNNCRYVNKMLIFLSNSFCVSPSCLRVFLRQMPEWF